MPTTSSIPGYLLLLLVAYRGRVRRPGTASGSVALNHRHLQGKIAVLVVLVIRFIKFRFTSTSTGLRTFFPASMSKVVHVLILDVTFFWKHSWTES